MCGSWEVRHHPNLTDDNCVKTSDADPAYNCIAWAAGDVTRWWWPARRRGISYWPPGVAREETIEAFVEAYATLGFQECANDSFEAGIEKIALFAINIHSIVIPTHAARQLDSGEWTSKMGSLEDIKHTTCAAPSGPIYGRPVCYLARPRPQVASTNI